MASLGSDVVFAASSTGTESSAGLDTELWLTNGTASGTEMITNLPVDGPLADVINMTSLGNKVVFAYYNGIDNDLWVTDGTAAGTTVIQNDASTSGAGAEILVPCFAAGTRIATTQGAIAVERL